MPARLRHSWHDIVVVAILGLIALILAWSGVVSNAKADTPIPDNPGTYVVDQTGILSPADKQRVEQRLARYERSRPDKPQFVVLIVKDLPDQGMEQFATEVFRKWGVGQKGADNGALEVIHPKADNHADVRLELGRGIEGAIPDMSASDINRKVLGPLWVKGQYADGIIAIADKLAASLDPVGPAQAASPQDAYYQQVSKPQGRGFGGWLVGLLIFAGGIALLLFLIKRERKPKRTIGAGTSNVRVQTRESTPYQDDNYHAAQAERLRRDRERTEADRQRQTERRKREMEAAERAEADRQRRAAEQQRSDASKMSRGRGAGAGAAAGLAAGAAGAAIGMAAEAAMERSRRERQEREDREERERRRRRDDDTSSYGSSLSSGSSGYSGGSSSYGGGSSSSGSSDSGYSGGGGDSGGGGSSDSF